MHKKNYQSGLSQTAWIVIGVIVIALIVVAIPLFSSDEARDDLGLETSPTPAANQPTPDLVQEIEQPATENGDTTLAAVLNNPELYAGQQVRVRGELGEWLSEEAFTLDSPQILTGNLLVVGASVPEPDNDQLLEDETMIVEAEGRVQILNVTDLQEEMDFNLGDAELEDWDGKPVLVTTSANVIQE